MNCGLANTLPKGYVAEKQHTAQAEETILLLETSIYWFRKGLRVLILGNIPQGTVYRPAVNSSVSTTPIMK